MKVYVGISGDFIHHGIVNIINEASKYGDVVVGCLTDDAIAEHKPLPLLTYEQRSNILSNIKNAHK